jgi:hypothetical protein
MDNLLIVPSVRETEWVQDVLPGTSPAELPVAGRRIIDYALECARKRNVMFTEILDWRFSTRLAADFSDLTRTGMPVFYTKGEGDIPRGLADVEGVSSPLTQTISDDLVVVWGLYAGSAQSDVPLEPVSAAEVVETPPGMYRREGGRWMRFADNGRNVDGIRVWHALNFDVLRRPDTFTLPGYSAEKDVHLGRNVVLEKGTEVKAPALLQDNIWCARNVGLLGNVIVGSGAFIAEGATLKGTVVCDNTFIGSGLELTDKIVAGRRIIDVSSECWTDVDEPGLAGDIRRHGVGWRWLRAVWHFMRGRSYGRRG